MQWWRIQLPMQETWFRPRVGTMAAHSRTAAWEVPWTEEPGGLWVARSWDTAPHIHTHAGTARKETERHLAWESLLVPLSFCFFFFFWFVIVDFILFYLFIYLFFISWRLITWFHCSLQLNQPPERCRYQKEVGNNQALNVCLKNLL